MNKKLNHLMINSTPGRMRGMTLLDVLLAIVVFVVGMLALASLQGNLTRSSADGNARTLATNIAEELIENLRTIEAINTPAGYVCQTSLVGISTENVYQCIGDSTDSVYRGFATEEGEVAFQFNVAAEVEDYYLMPDGVSITTDTSQLPTGWDTTISDFKTIELTVTWAGEGVDFGPAGFQGIQDENGEPVSDQYLGTGTFTVSTIIPSIPNLGAAKVAAADDDQPGTPPVVYTPGQRPDIIRIDLGGNKFKESTTPKPDVVRTGQLAETWFDVITYNQSATATFLRREEFLVISCECTMMAADPDNKALLPTVWNGQEYSRDRWVTKPYGLSANNQQSFYCDTCCRDHHDLAEGDSQLDPTSNTDLYADLEYPEKLSYYDQVYDPARLDNRPNWSESGGVSGDHKHYTRTNKGVLVEAGIGDTYVEACRMVRKDGFMRVAQDARQEGMVTVAEGYLDTQAGADTYSGYVTTEVQALYHDNYSIVNQAIVNNPRDRLEEPDPVDYPFPGDSSNPTALPFIGLDSQQMRSRGIYMDHLTAETLGLVKCISQYEGSYDPDAGGPTPGDRCGAPGVTNHFQVLPFFDTQITWLSWWEETPMGRPVSVTSDAVLDDNAHSRGYAVLEDPMGSGTVDVENWMHRGNIGLTVTDPITEADKLLCDGGARNCDYLEIAVNGGGDSPTLDGYVWEAIYASAVNRVEVADTVITENGNEYCNHNSTQLRCLTPNGEGGSITITGYTKLQGQTYIPLYICINDPNEVSLFSVTNADTDGSYNEATVTWTDLSNVQNLQSPTISIEESENACNAP